MRFILYPVLAFLLLASISSAQTCNTAADKDCDGKVNMTELADYINVWYGCSACAPDLLGAINAYYSIGGPASSAFSFAYPTLPDGASITETFADINLTINKSDIEEIGLSWDETDFPLYNDSLVFMSNFDNVPALGENGTFVRDISLHGNDGIVRGNAQWTQSGRYGGAFRFSKSATGYIDLGDRDYFSFIDGGGNPRPITMSAWVRMSDATSFQILGKGSGSGNEWSFLTSYSNMLAFYSRDPDGDYIGRSYSRDLSSLEGQWIHVAASYNGRNSSSHFRLYFNGERVDDGWYGSHSDAVYGGPRNTAQPLAIGMNSNGTVDEVRIWDRILSDEEIKIQYDSNLKRHSEDGWNFFTRHANLSKKDYAYYAWAEDSSGEREYSETRTFAELTDICVLTSAHWSRPSGDWEDEVMLAVNGTNCERRPVSFAVHENDGFGFGGTVTVQPETSLITGGSAATAWSTEWKDDSGTDPEYYFVATLADDPENTIQSGLMTVAGFCNATCLSLRVGCGMQNICGVMQDCGECLERKTSWEPIIGIPEPPFGISETHWMYDHATYDFGYGPEPYRMGDDGPYTHYVDSKNPHATDKYNPYGTKGKPRLTLPSSPPAGSVVEIHGGPYGAASFENSGTKEKPIFIRGIEGDEPIVNSVINVFGSYYIIENIDFDRQGRIKKAIYIDDSREENNSNIAIRHNEFHNSPVKNIEGVCMVRVISYNPNYSMENITIFNNHFHHSGEGRNDSISTRDIDGVGIGQNVKNIWIVNNLMHHHGGDSIALMESSLTDNSSILASHIYVGKNVMHDDTENAVDIKRTTNVVVSQNRMYNYGPTAYNPAGGGAALRYGTYDFQFERGRRNIWTIFNEIYNVSEQQGGLLAYNAPELGEHGLGDEEYFIGNIVRDCHREERNDSSALASWGQLRVYWINNIVYNCDIGGYFWGHLTNASQNENLTIINNIFGRLHDSKTPSNLVAFQILDYSGGKFLNQSEMSNNLFFDPRGGMKISYTWKQNTTSTKYNQNYYNISAWSQAYPAKSAGFIEEDPVFMSPGSNDFHLSPGSPAINAGADAKKYYDRFEQFFGMSIYNDFDGNPIVGRQDIGPYEHG